ncbi:hypothetical protein MRX96_005663 [Rhipicephalus microplus]
MSVERSDEYDNFKRVIAFIFGCGPFVKPSTARPDHQNSATSYAKVHPASGPSDHPKDASGPHSHKGDFHQSGVGAKAPFRQHVTSSPNARSTELRRNLTCLLGVYVYIIALMVTIFVVVYLFLKDERTSEEESLPLRLLCLTTTPDHSTRIPQWNGDLTKTTVFPVSRRHCSGDCGETTTAQSETLLEVTSSIGNAQNRVNVTKFPLY